MNRSPSSGRSSAPGGLIVTDEDTCMVDFARFFVDFIQDESCGKCPPCRIGTKRMLEILNRITHGQGEEQRYRQAHRAGGAHQGRSPVRPWADRTKPGTLDSRFFRARIRGTHQETSTVRPACAVPSLTRPARTPARGSERMGICLPDRRRQVQRGHRRYQGEQPLPCGAAGSASIPAKASAAGTRLTRPLPSAR